jgi:hypothetical protein
MAHFKSAPFMITEDDHVPYVIRVTHSTSAPDRYGPLDRDFARGVCIMSEHDSDDFVRDGIHTVQAESDEAYRCSCGKQAGCGHVMSVALFVRTGKELGKYTFTYATT